VSSHLSRVVTVLVRSVSRCTSVDSRTVDSVSVASTNTRRERGSVERMDILVLSRLKALLRAIGLLGHILYFFLAYAVKSI